MKNKEIKDSIKSANLYQWQVAEALGVGESTFSRKMRKELPEEEKAIILNTIDKLKKEAV